MDVPRFGFTPPFPLTIPDLQTTFLGAAEERTHSPPTIVRSCSLSRLSDLLAQTSKQRKSLHCNRFPGNLMTKFDLMVPKGPGV